MRICNNVYQFWYKNNLFSYQNHPHFFEGGFLVEKSYCKSAILGDFSDFFGSCCCAHKTKNHFSHSKKHLRTFGQKRSYRNRRERKINRKRRQFFNHYLSNSLTYLFIQKLPVLFIFVCCSSIPPYQISEQEFLHTFCCQFFSRI